jgi:hypothetical protein
MTSPGDFLRGLRASGGAGSTRLVLAVRRGRRRRVLVSAWQRRGPRSTRRISGTRRRASNPTGGSADPDPEPSDRGARR